MIRRVAIALWSLVLLAAPLLAQPPVPQPDEKMNEFVPLSSLPPSEQIPGGRLVIAAYGFFLVLMIFYMWTIWSRIGRVEREMHDLERRQGGAKR